MTRARLRALVLLAPFALVLPSAAPACGGAQDTQIGVAASPPPSQSDEWPLHAQSPGDAATVTSVLESADGATVRVRAYLVAVATPCPPCNVGGGARREEAPGRTSRPSAIMPPGCLPCPEPVATIADEPPGASGRAKGPPLRAVAVAGGLQPRHVGHVFLFTGVFHAHAEQGPELEVTDVRALD